MVKAKSTPVPLLVKCCNNDVFLAVHNDDECGNILLGVFSNKKTAEKCAAYIKKIDGFKGKEAKLHSYFVEGWVVSDKFNE